MSHHALAELDGWLDTFPRTGGFAAISEPKKWPFDEAAYDQQHNVSADHLQSGLGIVALLRELGAGLDGTALEIGCGTGHASIGVAHSGAFQALLLTDPSPDFLGLTRRKLRTNAIDDARVRYAVLSGEDVHQLPRDLFSAVILRSCLHHIVDVDAFMKDVAPRLRVGGVMAFQDPCLEGFLLAASVMKTLAAFAELRGKSLSAAHHARIQGFVEMVRFLGRTDIDKSSAEDKHLFRVDRVMKMADAAGLDTEFFPNRPFEHFVIPAHDRGEPDRFTGFFVNYCRYLLAWPEDLLALLGEHFASAFELVDQIDRSGNGPYLHGVFACTRRP